MIKIYVSGDAEKVIPEFEKFGFDYFSPRGLIASLSPEGRTDKSKMVFAQGQEMVSSNILLAVGDSTETAYDVGYWMALKDHFKYKSKRSFDEHQRYLVTLSTNGEKLDPMLHGNADAHLTSEIDLMGFCGIVAGNWDAPVGKENHPEWQNNSIRRRKILNQF